MRYLRSIGNIYDKEKVGRYYGMIGDDIEIRSKDEKYLIDSLPKSLEGRLVFDLGCGNGRYSELFCKFGAEKVVALDFSEEMINEVKKRKVKNGLKQLELVKADMNNMSFDPESFDLIFSRFSLMYGKDLHSVCKKIGQILKKKGQFFVLTNIFIINSSSLFKQIKKEVIPLDLLIGDKKVSFLNHPHTREEYRSAFIKAGLTIKDEKYFKAVGISTPSDYEFHNEIKVKRGFFKLSKEN